MVSCCGTATDDKDKQFANNAHTTHNGIVTHQPSPHPGAHMPGAEKSFYSSVPSPPPSTFQSTHPGGFTPSWGGSPSPPLDQRMSYAQNNMPPPGALFNATPPLPQSSYGSPAIQYPSAVHLSNAFQALRSPPLSTSPNPTVLTHSGPRNDFNAPSDEGKLSVSIDFGTTFSGVVRTNILPR